MYVGGFLYVLFFLKICDICNAKLTYQLCSLGGSNVGRCVPIPLCPQSANLTNSDSDFLTRTCDNGNMCCRVSAQIVTPTNAAPSAPGGAAPAGSAQPPSVGGAPSGAPPAGANNPPAGNGPPAGAGAPPGGAPPGGAPPSGAAPGGTFPGGAPPAGAPLGGATPGGAPPAGAAPGGAIPGGAAGAPPGGGPPNGGPTGGAQPNGAFPPSGSRPPVMASIVADPDLPSRALPPPSAVSFDTISVSAEIIDNTIDTVDKKCELYHSSLPSIPGVTSNSRSLTPVVMIYGGTNTEEKEFPHMAALGYGEPNSKQWLCAGSLISENYVVTAAHCLSAAPLGEVRYVKLGNTRLDQDTQNTQQFNVIGRKSHEQYDPQHQYNDVALLQLDRPVQFTEYVLPICLFSSTNYEDKNLIATGWGKTESGTTSMDLKKVGLELFTQSECSSAYSVVSKQQLPLGIQESTQVCAGSRTESKDTCQGDSGGPLQIRKNNRWYLIGITSIGVKCGNVKYPGVYTRVAYFVQWIQQNVWNK